MVRHIGLIAALLAVLVTTATAGGLYQSFHQASLSRVLLDLATAAHQDVVISDDVRGLVELELKGDDPRQVLQDLAKVRECAVMDLQGIWVITAKGPSKTPAVVGLPDSIARRQISLSVHWIQTAALVTVLSRELETTLIAPEDYSSRITAALDHRPAPVALAAIAAAMRCSVEVHGRLIALQAAPRAPLEPHR